MQIDFEIVHGLLYVPDMCVPVKEYIGSDKQTDRMSQRRAPQKKNERSQSMKEGKGNTQDVLSRLTELENLHGSRANRWTYLNIYLYKYIHPQYVHSCLSCRNGEEKFSKSAKKNSLPSMSERGS